MPDAVDRSDSTAVPWEEAEGGNARAWNSQPDSINLLGSAVKVCAGEGWDRGEGGGRCGASQVGAPHTARRGSCSWRRPAPLHTKSTRQSAVRDRSGTGHAVAEASHRAAA